MVHGYRVEQLDGSDRYFVHPASPAGEWVPGACVVLRLWGGERPPEPPAGALEMWAVIEWRNGLEAAFPGRVTCHWRWAGW